MAFLKKARDERLTSLTILSLGTTSLDLCTCQSHRGGCALVCALVPCARLLRAATAASKIEKERTALANEPDGKSRGDLAIISNVSQAFLRFILVAGSHFPS